MTLLGNEFAAIFLCSGSADDLQQRLSDGARRLEWENRLTVFLRPLEGQPRPPVPAAGSRLARISAEGEDRAGIVVRICRRLADLSINIADLRSETQPSPSGSAIYRMSLLVEVPDSVNAKEFSSALDEVGREIGVEVRVEPAE
jgi:glycine cleavage system regulatory protein